VTGLADDHWALISKVHHCMVDGVSGTDLYRVIFDVAPQEYAPPAETPSKEPSTAWLMLRAAAESVVLPASTARAAASAVAHPMGTLAEAVKTARAMWAVSAEVRPAIRSSLSGPIRKQRRYTWVRVELEDLKSIKRELGGTVNDVALAAITAGFRELLVSRGETPKPHTVPSLVPVSLRAPGEESLYDNRVSAMIVDLPVQLSKSEEQLSAVRERLAGLKAAGESRVGEAMVSLASYFPYPLVSLNRRWAFRAPQREIVTVTTNVPGPRHTLYCLGRPLVEIIPYVPISSTVRIGVSIFSYRDQMTFGLTGDYDSTPDLEVLAQGIRHGVADLMKAARSDGR
jgi:diacylglycerol O-acyltransferase